MQLKETGFTLSEILITLGIIGIVSALTIPGLITKIQDNRNSALLKEDYSILQQMMISANEDGAIGTLDKSNDMDSMRKWFDTYFLPYIKTAHVCYNEAGCWNKNVKTSSGKSYASGPSSCGGSTISFILNNGSFICMDDFNDTRFGVKLKNTSIGLIIDVNGNKKPNIIGKDVFTAVFKDDKLLPGGYDMSKEQIDQNCSEKCSGNYCGTYCLTKVINQGFKLPVMGNEK